MCIYLGFNVTFNITIKTESFKVDYFFAMYKDFKMLSISGGHGHYVPSLCHRLVQQLIRLLTVQTGRSGDKSM